MSADDLACLHVRELCQRRRRAGFFRFFVQELAHRAEIRDLRLEFVGDQNIRRFDVTMHRRRPVIVQIRQPFGRSDRYRQPLVPGHSRLVRRTVQPIPN